MNNKIEIKKIPMTLATIVISLALLHCLAFGKNLPPVKGGVLPEIKTPVTVNATDKRRPFPIILYEGERSSKTLNFFTTFQKGFFVC